MARLRISRTILLVALGAALTMFVPATAAARVHVGVGVYGGPFWPYAYGPYYGPGWWGPYGYPYAYPYGGYGGYYGGYYGGQPLGQVKIKSPEPDAKIYINGAYAGRAHELKHFYLKPGTYRIEQRSHGNVQKERIYVIADRTVHLQFGPVTGGAPPPPEPEPED